MKKQIYNIATYGDANEKARRNEFVKLLKQSPLPDDEVLMNMALFLTPQNLSRILFMDFLYKQIIDTQGVIIEFGCRWGQNLSLFSALRGIYEPFNRLRKIIGFDTFAGFNKVSVSDGNANIMAKGSYGVTKDYELYLKKIMDLQEQESPLAHLKKYEIIKGDAVETIKTYLKDNPETIIALVYFDMDLYEPTKKCLLSIKDRLTQGSIIGFDEINDHSCPGETLALKEVFGLNTFPIQRFSYNSRTSYIKITPSRG